MKGSDIKSSLPYLVPIILSLSVFVTLGLVGLFLLICTWPVLYIVDGIFRTQFHLMSTEKWSPDASWPIALIANVVLPILYIPVYQFLKKKFTGKRLFFFSMIVYYLILSLISLFIFSSSS